ncbi:MAG: metalloregulator ArsR/SmtB family transcription factor [bacterium]
MTLKNLRTLLKTMGDDVRLRTINILSKRGDLSVTQICNILNVSQPTMSKHLVRLRLLKIVNDRRDGNRVYYSLADRPDNIKILKFLMSEFSDIEAFRMDNLRSEEILDVGAEKNLTIEGEQYGI